TSDDSEDEEHPYDLSIYLVEYDDNDLFGIVALPQSDRGYAKNEIVAAVVELHVPKGENPYPDYKRLAIEGESVSFDVTDNKTIITTDNVGPIGLFQTDDLSDGGYYPLGPDTFDASSKAKTFKALVFAKVTGDEASITVKLIEGEGTNGFDTPTEGGVPTLSVTLDGGLYTITKHDVGSDDGFYLIVDEEDGNKIRLYVDDDNKTIGMAINPDEATSPSLPNFIPLGVNTDNELGIVVGATVKTDGDDYDEVMDVYEDIVVDVFGLDYFLIGNYLRDSFFEDLVSADTITATVDIEPWTAYVTVPDNIVVDPPKTGDAASIMGFVMVALSGAGAVALKKRG
ncbi:MAG: hypothetical protein AAGU32_00170, partial [Bacillota bacterium]